MLSLKWLLNFGEMSSLKIVSLSLMYFFDGHLTGYAGIAYLETNIQNCVKYV